MLFYFLIIFFIFGLAIGSFLNVVIYKLEDKKRKDLKGRSFCPGCKYQLGFWDLIPVFSWIFLGAKCRYCGEKISIQYPVVELATGLIFLLTFYFSQNELFLATGSLLAIGLAKLLLLLIINCLFLVIFVYDLKHKIIPDKIIYPAIVLTFGFVILALLEQYISGTPFPELLRHSATVLLSAFAAGGFFYALAAVSNGKWMGGGDIKLAFFMGLFLGWPNILVAMFLGFFLGSIIGVFLIAIGKKNLGSEIPFGPFLITGTWIALFWGDKVVEWYLRIIGF